MALGSRIRNVVSGNARKKASGSPGCQVCRDSPRLYRVKFQLVNEAAIAGCFWCATIVDGLRTLAQKQSSLLRLPDGWEDEALVQVWYENVECSQFIEFPQWGFKAQFYVDKDLTRPVVDLVELRHLKMEERPHLSMDLPNGPLEFAAGAIQNCARNHQSYVKSAMLKKTWEDLSKMTVGFPFTDLPAVFRDAVIATRLLKIRYLWIDALCIAQGSPEEWSKESVKMRDVYSSACVTIVAASSASCDESFLAMRHRSFIKAFKLGRHPESMNRDVYVRLESSHSIDGFGLPNAFMFHPVDHRGWVLQEVLLSRRVLEFGNHCLAYSCLESSTCECGGCEQERSTMRLREDFTSQVKETQPPSVWHSLVRDYTRRQLTVASDKLPAIAGLAAYLKSRGSPDNAYIAGLWTDSFVPDLTWYRDAWVEYHVSRMQTDGPSWSWVSADREVNFWATGKNYMAHTKLVDHKCPYGTGGEFGIPKSAVITLEGPACPLRLVWDPQHATIQLVAHGSLAEGLSFWNRRHSKVHTLKQGSPFLKFYSSTDDICLDHPLEVAFLPDGTGRTVRPNHEALDFGNHGLDFMVDLLLLLVEKQGQFLRAFFLILAKSDTHEQRYIRIGVFWQKIGYRHQGFMGMNKHSHQRRWNRWVASMETKRFILI
ncbi:hypothetical protein LTR06_008977 [Exophiala xenobiotica]|nr:hypothetical protein LTR06_008977 [Exophiala xenobiotica]